MRKVTTRIVFEQHEVSLFRRRRPNPIFFCEDCRANVTMLTTEHAAELIGESVSRLVELVRARTVHGCVESKGSLLVCLFSLSSIQIDKSLDLQIREVADSRK